MSAVENLKEIKPMKKVFSMSFILFAATLCFSAQAGKTDKVVKDAGFTIPTTTSDLPFPIAGCSLAPPDCPRPPM